MKFDKDFISTLNYFVEYCKYKNKKKYQYLKNKKAILEEIPSKYKIKTNFKTVFGTFNIALYKDGILKFLIEIPKNEKDLDSSIRKLCDVIASIKNVECVIISKEYEKIKKKLNRSNNIYYKNLILSDSIEELLG